MNSEQYDKTRREFDQLGTQDKAVFLVEAVASTLARGVEKFGRAVVDEVDRAFNKSRSGAGATEEGKATGASEPGAAAGGPVPGDPPEGSSAPPPETPPM